MKLDNFQDVFINSANIGAISFGLDSRPIKMEDLTAIKPGQNVEIKYFKWAGKYWVKSIDIKKTPKQIH